MNLFFYEEPSDSNFLGINVVLSKKEHRETIFFWLVERKVGGMKSKELAGVVKGRGEKRKRRRKRREEASR